MEKGAKRLLTNKEMKALWIKASQNIFIIKEKVLKNDWTCSFPNCKQASIKSHLLQKNGILDQIAEDHHVYVLWEQPSRSLENRFKFKRRPIRFSLTYPLFCNKHDRELFELIEKKPFKQHSKLHHLLIYLRCASAEKRKLEIRYKINQNLISEINLFHDELRNENEFILERINDFVQFENRLGLIVNGTNSQNEFACYSLPIPKSKLPICGTGIFTYVDSVTQAYSPNIFINLIPRDSTTWFTYGWFSSDASKLTEFQNNIFSNGIEGMEKLISNLLLRHIEDWAINPTFYENKIESRKEFILKSFSTSSINYGLLDLDFNLFAE